LLLRAVVEVSLDPAASLVGRCDDPKSVMRCSASAGNCSRFVPTAIDPQRDPPTIIGTATEQRIRNRCVLRLTNPEARLQSSTRADRPVRTTLVNANSDSSCTRLPTGSSSLAVPLLATMTIVSSGSSRPIVVAWASRSRSPSSATAEKTSAGDTPLATRVATRRSAACSPASRLSSLSACRRSVTSRATPYMDLSSRTGVDVHSSTLYEPSL
jgi:hypothetical protein